MSGVRDFAALQDNSADIVLKRRVPTTFTFTVVARARAVYV